MYLGNLSLRCSLDQIKTLNNRRRRSYYVCLLLYTYKYLTQFSRSDSIKFGVLIWDSGGGNLRMSELESVNLEGGSPRLTALCQLERNKAKDLSWPAQSRAHLVKEGELGGRAIQRQESSRDTMVRNNGVKMGEVICEGTGGSRRPERRYRKGRRKGGGQWRELSLVTRLKSGSLEVSMWIWPPFLTRLADVAIIHGVFALSTPVMEEKKSVECGASYLHAIRKRADVWLYLWMFVCF